MTCPSETSHRTIVFNTNAGPTQVSRPDNHSFTFFYKKPGVKVNPILAGLFRVVKHRGGDGGGGGGICDTPLKKSPNIRTSGVIL